MAFRLTNQFCRSKTVSCCRIRITDASSLVLGFACMLCKESGCFECVLNIHSPPAIVWTGSNPQVRAEWVELGRLLESANEVLNARTRHLHFRNIAESRKCAPQCGTPQGRYLRL